MNAMSTIWNPNPGPFPWPPMPGPSPWPPMPGPGCWPPQWPTYRGNLPDSNVGQHGWFFQDTTRGYGIDLNGDGRYTRGQDGVLAFDVNRDGRIGPHEIEQSNQMLKAFGGNYDANGDGRVTFCERMQGQRYRQQMGALDGNHDGRLDANELASGGGRVLVDQNRDGKFGPWEQYSPYDFPTPGFGRGSIGYVDPRCNYTQTYERPGMWGGWGGWGGWAQPQYR